jgi:hypothetical protein
MGHSSPRCIDVAMRPSSSDRQGGGLVAAAGEVAAEWNRTALGGASDLGRDHGHIACLGHLCDVESGLVCLDAPVAPLPDLVVTTVRASFVYHHGIGGDGAEHRMRVTSAGGLNIGCDGLQLGPFQSSSSALMNGTFLRE